MDDKKKDYYDMPTEWLPSSNVADRPASEIGERNPMDRPWTFFISSSSSSLSSCAEDGPTGKLRNVVKSSQPEPDAPQRYTIQVTSPTDDAQKTRMRSLDDDMKVMKRPRMRKKSATAPPGALNMPDYGPQPHRRAISARLRRSNTIKKRTPQPESAAIAPLVVAKNRNDGQAEPDAQLPPSKRTLPHPQRRDVQFDNSQRVRDTQLPGSFSQKASVKKTLDGKNLGRLNTTILDFESHERLNSPTSMLNTPRDLYAIPEQQPTRHNPSSPHSIDARRSILLSLSKTSSSTLLQKVPERKLRHDVKARDIGLSVRQRTYLPGAIRLEEHAAMLRKDSVAVLDPFDKVIGPRGKRFSDMIVLDSITMYFEDLGITESATEQCLDQYWRDASQVPRHVSRNPSIPSVEESPLKSSRKPRSMRSPHGSRVPFSSASSTPSQPRSGARVRQRDRFRWLLSPAFPGSAFLRTPSDWGQQIEHS